MTDTNEAAASRRERIRIRLELRRSNAAVRHRNKAKYHRPAEKRELRATSEKREHADRESV